MADNIPITAGSGTNVATDDDGTAHHQYVKLEFGADNTQTKVSTSNPLPVTLANATTGSVAVYFDQSAPTVKAQYGSGTFLVAFDRGNPAVNLTSGTLTNITNTVGVYFDRANPSVSIGGASASVGIYFDRGNPAVNLTSGTLTSITNTVGVYFDRGNPSVSIGGASTSVGIYFDRGNPAVNLTSGTLTNVTNTVAVYFDRGTPAVNVAQYGGNALLTPTNGIPVVNTSATMSISTVSGTTSTAGNNTLISPSSAYNFKVFVYAIQTTAISSIAPRFTTGASAGATELWRPLITPVDTGTAAKGANLAVSPPGYIFATGVNTTLSLYLDAGSLVHYSVSYIKETA